MSITNHNTKCPQCGGTAIIYEEEGRYFLECYSCGYKNYLKLIPKPNNYVSQH
jgi:ribosomal protein S27AE